MPTYDWQKSSYCGEGSSCVELAVTDRTIALRESEAPEAVIATSPRRLRTFLEATKAGKLDGRPE